MRVPGDVYYHDARAKRVFKPSTSEPVELDVLFRTLPDALMTMQMDFIVKGVEQPNEQRRK